MVRQCAWCLCLINTVGERVSLSPLPKIYEATHGICGICGIQWMEQVIETDLAERNRQDDNNSFFDLFSGNEQQDKQEMHEAITQLVLQLQQKPAVPTSVPAGKQRKRIRTF